MMGGVCDFKGKSYFFYHNGQLPGGGGFTRSVAVEEFSYNSDGSFPVINMTSEGPAQVSSLNPYVRNEAETICWSSGTETEKCSAGGIDVCDIQDGECIKISGVDFENGAVSFNASVSSATDGGKITLMLDSTDGKIIGSCDVSNTGGWQEWQTISCNINDAEGKHDLYLVFSGSSWALFNMDWWQFTADSSEPDINGWYFADEFEGNLCSWESRGSSSIITSGRTAYAGSESLLVQNREAAWNGAFKSLSTVTFVSGNEYSFSVNVTYFNGSATDKFYLKLQYTDANGDTQYDTIAEGTGIKGEWIQLANMNYMIPSGASDLKIYVETAEKTNNFYIDEVIGAVGGTGILGAGESKDIVPGDVNFDGVINCFDLALAKRGYSGGFERTELKFPLMLTRAVWQILLIFS